MNRNTEAHFGQVPMINQKRSKFDRSHSHKTTFNAGDIIPVYVDGDILPGDTVTMGMAELIRMATPIYPIADNLYADIYYFFIPHRLVWEHWQEFWGENDDPWIQQTEYEIPQIEAPEGGWTEGTIADYMRIPTKKDGFSIDALQFRAYVKVWNDWFRDENLLSNCHIYTDETTRTGMNGTEAGYTDVIGAEFGGKPLKAAKFHGYFTSATPSTQKGPAVRIPLGTSAIVRTDTVENTIYDTGIKNPLQMRLTNDGQTNTMMVATTNGVYSTDAGYGTIANAMYPTNLIADLSDATAATISQLRTAFAIQKYYEALTNGSRYIEWIKNVFGVTSSDARLQRAEYLGGTRVPINIDQIIQTSSTDSVSPQGNTAGFSCTLNNDESLFSKSFEEHGTLLGLMVIRTDRTYQQGLPRQFSRKKWSDFYNPFFANLSNQAILNKEIYLQGRTVVDTDGNIVDEQAFGYQEAWAEYRYQENGVSGYMRSNASGSLDVWHFADDYSQLPMLSGEWIQEPKENVNRTIAVSSQISHQFLADIFFKAFYTRCMPVYSVPGLIDHV